MPRLGPSILAALFLLAGACAPATGDATIHVQLANDSIELSQDTVNSGRIVFATTNTSADLVHEIEVFSGATKGVILPVSSSVADTAGLELVDEIEDIVPGATADLTVDLAPGTYLVVCNLPGHYAQGMWSYLEVMPQG